MKVIFLADAMLPRNREHNLSSANSVQYSELPVLRTALASIPHAVLLGPVLLATVLRDKGHRVQILECAFRPQQMANLRRVLSSEPDIVCLSTTFFPDYEFLMERVASIRALAPKATLVLGGPSLAEDPRISELADYSIVGEGERALPLLLEALSSGEKYPSIDGLCYKKEGKHVSFPPRLLADLDAVPFPDWSLVNRSEDDFYLIATQRGCKWRCAFCTYPANEGWALRYRSIDSLMSEIRHNYEKFGIRKYMFADSTFTHPVDRCVQFLEQIAKLPFRVEWAAYARADTINEKMADAMQASGCVGLFFGIESGHDDILAKMKKGFTFSQAERGIRLLDGRNITRTASWVIGFPGETLSTAWHTADKIEGLGCEQNMINTFYLSEQAPAGMRKSTFDLSGQSNNWTHATMSFSEASEITAKIVRHLVDKRVQIGHVFDLLWLSSVGWSVPETLHLFRMAQAYSAKKDAQLDKSIVEACEKLLMASRTHPIFQRIESIC